MTCPHLEETSALFDGVADERARMHAEGCAECSAFLADAAQLRTSLREWSGGLQPAEALGTPIPRARRAEAHRSTMRFALPAFAILVLMLFWIARPRTEPESERASAGVFAGLDGGGRATITVREVAR